MKFIQYGNSIFHHSNPVVILEVPAPRAACLPQPRHDPVAERAPCVRHPPSCSLVFSERKCFCVGCRGDWVFYLVSDLDDWGSTCVSLCPALSLNGEIRHYTVVLPFSP